MIHALMACMPDTDPLDQSYPRVIAGTGTRLVSEQQPLTSLLLGHTVDHLHVHSHFRDATARAGCPDWVPGLGAPACSCSRGCSHTQGLQCNDNLLMSSSGTNKPWSPCGSTNGNATVATGPLVMFAASRMITSEISRTAS